MGDQNKPACNQRFPNCHHQEECYNQDIFLRDSHYKVCEANYMNLNEKISNSHRQIYYQSSSGTVRDSLSISFWILDELQHLHWVLPGDCKAMQVQFQKYWTTGKLEYIVLWWVSKYFPSINIRHKDKCKIVETYLNKIIQPFPNFLVVKNPHCSSILRQINQHAWKLEIAKPLEQKSADKNLSLKSIT